MLHKSSILIIDDDSTARDTLEATLLSEGYDLAFACDGPQALEKAAKLTPDLVLLDVMMPGMDGFEVCQRLRADSHLAQIPIILLTALDDRDSRLQGIQAGADDFISKPFDSIELQARVRNITRLNRYRQLLLEQAKFEWVVEQAQDGYLILDQADQILYANHQARLYLALPLSEQGKKPLTDKPFLTCAQAQYRLEPQKAWASWPEPPPTNPSSPRYLLRPESSTSNALWLDVNTLDLLLGGPTNRVIRLGDVTIQINQQRDIHGFHQVISHKLRTPLTLMIGGLELLSQHVSTMSSSQISEFSTMTLRGAKRLHSEILDILRYLHAPTLAKQGSGYNLSQIPSLVSKISNGLELANTSVSLNECLNEANITLSERGLEFILGELLENAKKFHPEQSPTVHIKLSPSNANKINIKVIDDGLTLSPEQLAQVWQPYYQGDKDCTGQVNGMGLGLSSVASLVWEAGGNCQLYNRQDQPGVIVELYLPLQ